MKVVEILHAEYKAILKTRPDLSPQDFVFEQVYQTTCPCDQGEQFRNRDDCLDHEFWCREIFKEVIKNFKMVLLQPHLGFLADMVNERPAVVRPNDKAYFVIMDAFRTVKEREARDVGWDE